MQSLELFSPFSLPCGVRLKNRIVKSAMSDSLGDGAGNPTATQINLYERWALGGAAASIVGEVQTDPRYPEKPGNLVLHEESDEDGFRQLAKRGAVNDTHLWAQLGNAGALAHPPIGTPKGPSKFDFSGLSCAELSKSEIAQIPSTYARAAKRAENFGFGGVQIHAAHGFLLGQFLSPLFNRRTDEYGGTITRRMQLLMEVVEAVRRETDSGFAVALKINSSDQLEGGLLEAESLKIIKALDKTGLDLIDISGGTYFPGAKSSSDRRSDGPYFVEFARQARKLTSIPLMATGGFSQKSEVAAAISGGAVDFAGLARAFVLDSSLPTTWQESEKNPNFPVFDSPPKGGITAWYSMQLTEIGEGRQSGKNLNMEKALLDYETRDKKREKLWNAAYGTA